MLKKVFTDESLRTFVEEVKKYADKMSGGSVDIDYSLIEFDTSEIVIDGDLEPVTFNLIEDDKLIILGAHTINSMDDGLYLDCEPDASEPDIPEPDIPDSEWVYPVLNGNVLTIEQVYSATQNGNVLVIE